MDNVVVLFPKKESLKQLTASELEEFKEIILKSVSTFHELSVMEKLSLYETMVNFSITCIDIISVRYGIEEKEE